MDWDILLTNPHLSYQMGVWVTSASAPMQIPISHSHPPGSPPLVQFAPPPRVKLDLLRKTAVMIKVTLSTVLYFTVLDLTSHTVSALPTGEVHTQLSDRGGIRRKLASSFPISFPLEKPLGNTMDHGMQCWTKTRTVTDTILSVLRHNYLHLNDSWSGFFGSWVWGFEGRE